MIHVCPLNDIEEHDVSSTSCWCCPEVLFEEEIIIVHNAFDGRFNNEKTQNESKRIN